MTRVVIDVREPEEFAVGHYPKAINIPSRQIKKIRTTHPEISLDDEIILYCESGMRAGTARRKLEKLGFTSVIARVNQYQVD